MLWAILRLEKSKGTAIPLILAMHSSINNGLVFFYLFTLITLFKKVARNKGGIDVIIKSLIEIATVYAICTVLIWIPSGIRCKCSLSCGIKKIFSWSMFKAQWRPENINQYNLLPLIAKHSDQMLIDGLKKGKGISEAFYSHNKAS